MLQQGPSVPLKRRKKRERAVNQVKCSCSDKNMVIINR